MNVRPAAAALAAAAVFSLTGCGGGAGEAVLPASAAPASSPTALPTPTPPLPPAPAPPVGGMADQDVRALLITPADVPDHLLTAPTRMVSGSAGVVSERPVRPECWPVSRALSGTPGESPSGRGRVVAVARPKELLSASEEERRRAAMGFLGLTTTVVGVSSHDGARAAESFEALKAAAQACAAGYETEQGRVLGEITAVTPATPPVVPGHEVLAYTVERDRDGVKSTGQLVVVRKEPELLSFYAETPAGAAAQPGTLVAAQIGKLG